MTKRLLAIMVVLSTALAACNTVAGAGRDVAAGGKAISNTAEQAK
ncbi:entericidin [Burkholderia territorii]|uniref:Entericidin n=1 Tax=Burkholderia territorii TaxID=1503055 RepID=A0A108EB14_9BURK|nr:entericidin A/B family lipoprotein [Burkholderia territorii]KWN07975.1 entericidin [Burkholderia territorii]